MKIILEATTKYLIRFIKACIWLYLVAIYRLQVNHDNVSHLKKTMKWQKYNYDAQNITNGTKYSHMCSHNKNNKEKVILWIDIWEMTIGELLGAGTTNDIIFLVSCCWSMSLAVKPLSGHFDPKK